MIKAPRVPRRLKGSGLGFRCSLEKEFCINITRALILYLVAERIHSTLFGIILYYKTESVHFLGLMNSATRYMGVSENWEYFIWGSL